VKKRYRRGNKEEMSPLKNKEQAKGGGGKAFTLYITEKTLMTKFKGKKVGGKKVFWSQNKLKEVGKKIKMNHQIDKEI